MTPKIRVTGDWDAKLDNVEAVTSSAADCFDAFEETERIAISLEPVAAEDDPPITLFSKNAADEFVIRLNVRGNLWARLVYQFAHEFCHVIADPTTFVLDRFTWIEEVLCETGSLFALRQMANTWEDNPPYPNWRDYAPSLEQYAADRMTDPAHTLPGDLPFRAWLAKRLPTLESDSGNRASNTVIAKECMPIFENDDSAWRSFRLLHACPRPASASALDFMRGWAAACPRQLRAAVEELTGRLGIA